MATRSVLSYALRWSHGLRRLAARLPPSEEAVWPGVRNDLFVAHESVYAFVAERTRGRRVLDAACGTGYGSDLLARSGAEAVLGIDLSDRRVAYARRTFRAPNLTFARHDCEHLELESSSRDLIVSSNTLEHLARPELFLRAAERILTSEGELVVAVPPVLSAADVAVHGTNRYHAAPLSVRAWAELFDSEGWSLRFYAHRALAPLDLASPFRSRRTQADFELREAPWEDAYREPPLCAVFVLRRRH